MLYKPHATSARRSKNPWRSTLDGPRRKQAQQASARSHAPRAKRSTWTTGTRQNFGVCGPRSHSGSSGWWDGGGKIRGAPPGLGWEYIRERHLTHCGFAFPFSSSRQQRSQSSLFNQPLASHRRIILTIATMNNNMNNNNNMNAGKEDYLDKALDKVEQMAGKKVCAQMSQTYTNKKTASTDSNHSPATPSTQASTERKTRRSPISCAECSRRPLARRYV